MREPGGRFLPFLLGRAAFMGLRVGYNWMQIVSVYIINLGLPHCLYAFASERKRNVGAKTAYL